MTKGARQSCINDELAEQLAQINRDNFRIVYVPGPGSLRESYLHWRDNRDDPRKAVVTYGAMFFDVVYAIGAEALIIERNENEVSPHDFADRQFRFRNLLPPRMSGKLAYWRMLRSQTKEIITQVNAFEPDIVLIGGDIFLPMLPKLKPQGARLILSLHNMLWQFGDPRRDFRARIKSLIGLSIQKVVMGAAVNVCVTVGYETQRQFMELTKGQIPCFSSVHQIAVQPDLAVDDTRKEGQTIAYLGRIETEKGVFDLLSGFELMREQHVDMPANQLIFAGDGGALDALRSRSEKSKYSHNIKCLGIITGGEANALLRKADLLVCPTRTKFKEGLPAVLAEAVFQSTPLLVSSVVPAKEIYGDACAIYAADKVESLADQLAAILCNPELLQSMVGGTKKCQIHLRNTSKSWGSSLAEAILTTVCSHKA